MERVCFLARVRSDKLEEYRTRHRKVWPEMTDALHSAGWANYTLFLADDGLLVGYLETDDYAAAQRRMATSTELH
jgi:L-rhamnose mutarotase